MLGIKLGNSLNTAGHFLTPSYSLQLTGTEFMSADDAAGLFNTSEGSISVWVRIDTMSATGFICRYFLDSNNTSQIIYHDSSQEIRFAYKGGGTNRTVVFDASSLEGDNTFHHLLATWKKSTNTIKIYLDGVLKATSTSALGTFSGSPTLFDIGQNTAGASFFKGLVAQYSLFDREITTVTEVYGGIQKNNVVNVTGKTGLKSYYKFNEGTGTTAIDSSGSNKPGTLSNTPSYSKDVPL